MSVVSFVAKGVASFALNKGLNRLFESKEDLEGRLLSITKQTIKLFEERYPIEDAEKNFPFYDSSAILEAMLKFRLFPTEDFDSQVIFNEIEKNPLIIKPTSEEISVFMSIFNDQVEMDDKLKQIEIDATFKERIFIIENKIDKINETLQLQLIEVVPLLQEEYKEELDECYREIKTLKFKTALNRLNLIESRIEKNTKHIPDKLISDLLFYKALCFESLDNDKSANENFILAFKRFPQNIKYKSRACLAYYKLKDIKWKTLKEEIELTDDYNIECWYISLLEALDKLIFLKTIIPLNILESNRFKRLAFNLNQINPFANLSDLVEILDVELSDQLPQTLDYDNIYHWFFMLNVASFDYFQKEPIMYSKSAVINYDRWKYFYDLSTLVSIAVFSGEFSESVNTIHFIRYWLELEINEKNILKLVESYENLHKKDSFYTLLMANSIQKYENTQKALDFIESRKELIDYNLVLLRTFCQIQIVESPVDIKDLFSYVSIIDNFCVNQICRYLEPILRTERVNNDELLDLIYNSKYTNEHYKNLLNILVKCTIKDSGVLVNDVNLLSENLKGEPNLNEHISFIYYENGNYDECIAFIRTYLDESVASQDMVIYIEALNKHRKDKQTELLRLLEKWRNNFSFHSRFLRMEFELRQILDDTKSIYQISKYAVDHLPDDESFYTVYIVSLYQLQYDAEFETQISKIKSFKFERTENALNIVHVLFQKGYFQESLDILYEKAMNPDDVLARTNYFGSTIKFPNELFKDYDKVEEKVYVRFEIDGETQIKHIKANAKEQLLASAIGKTKGEEFIISAPHSNLIKTVKIVRIMNKYLALFDEICNEAHSQFSSLPLDPIKIVGDDIKSFEKMFVERYGESQQQYKNQFDENIKAYNNYSIGYSELTSRNFRGNFIDAYLYLTSSQSNGFLIFPISLINDILLIDDNRIVLDFTSAMLFYKLEQNIGLSFGKYVVSKSLIHVIEKCIVEAKESSKSNMTIHVVGNRVVPNFLSDEFHQSRLEFLQNFLKWVIEHTEQITPEEKIDIMRPLYDDGKVEPYFESMIDIVFLGQRDGYIIVSDDISYRKLLPFISAKMTSTELFLLKNFPVKINQIYEYLLQQRYVGLTISKEVLYSAYINQNKKELEHIFQYAIRSITIKDTFSIDRIHIIVDFLRDIALNPLISHEKYLFDATNIFVMMIKAISNPKDLLALQSIIESKFKLTGHYYNTTRIALLNAMRIFNP